MQRMKNRQNRLMITWCQAKVAININAVIATSHFRIMATWRNTNESIVDKSHSGANIVISILHKWATWRLMSSATQDWRPISVDIVLWSFITEEMPLFMNEVTRGVYSNVACVERASTKWDIWLFINEYTTEPSLINVLCARWDLRKRWIHWSIKECTQGRLLINVVYANGDSPIHPTELCTKGDDIATACDYLFKTEICNDPNLSTAFKILAIVFSLCVIIARVWFESPIGWTISRSSDTDATPPQCGSFHVSPYNPVD